MSKYSRIRKKLFVEIGYLDHWISKAEIILDEIHLKLGKNLGIDIENEI